MFISIAFLANLRRSSVLSHLPVEEECRGEPRQGPQGRGRGDGLDAAPRPALRTGARPRRRFPRQPERRLRRTRACPLRRIQPLRGRAAQAAVRARRRRR